MEVVQFEYILCGFKAGEREIQFEINFKLISLCTLFKGKTVILFR